jgi:hypothetical protein
LVYWQGTYFWELLFTPTLREQNTAVWSRNKLHQAKEDVAALPSHTMASHMTFLLYRHILRRRHRIICALAKNKRRVSVSTHRSTQRSKYERSPSSETWSKEWDFTETFPLTRDIDFLSGVDLDTFCHQMDPI